MGRYAAWILACCLLSSGTAAAQTLDRIAASGTVTIGYVPEQRPFASAASGAEPSGYAIELCGVVADEIGRSVKDLKRV